MKLKNLTLAVLAASLGVASVAAQAEVSVSGRVNVGVEKADGGDATLRNYASRVRVKASSELDNGLTGYGNYEFGVGTDTDTDTFTTRIAQVGLKGAFGDVSLGHGYQTYYNFGEGLADLGIWDTCIGCIGGSSRTGEALTYTGKMGVASVGATAYMGDSVDQHGDGFELGGSAELGNVTLSGAMRDTDAKAEPLYTVGASTKMGPVKVAGTYSTQKNNADGMNLHFGYGDAYLNWGQVKNDVTGVKADGVGVGYTYKMGGGTQLWFEAVDFDASGTTLRSGLRYDF